MPVRIQRPTDFPPITHDPDTCFFCAEPLNAKNRSVEHVFPEWLLHRYDLWHQLFTLPTGQTIQYRKIRIPACRSCNNVYLGRLERTIERACRSGYDKFVRLHRQRMFQWLSKILYEVMYLDARWFVDLKDPGKGTILERDGLRDFRAFFQFLQSVRNPMRFQLPAWSIFVFRTEATGNTRADFDYVDCPAVLTIGLRMGDIGIISALQDHGSIVETWAPLAKRLRREVVNPMQFREAFARITYAASLMNRVPKYLTIFGKPITVFAVPLQGLSAKPLFDEWRTEVFAGYLSFYCQIPPEECYSPERGLLTFLGAPGGT